ncbi:hypothetical protein HU200_010976 [Digitaria exilis]|uniref:C2H2-type domain-containing protein n=1 Tax=Digitaria exilis TaxID=1010633 RepID=A0A835FI62_9POAL|nr:hypothetical protein HU200_010976 [Digitaria exilis]CAB3492530.1 unnamed protein product [Digitaria exilis]CAB3497533.1 unnamed protein product [Digitaria exilis]
MAMEAHLMHEQSRSATGDDPSTVLTYLTFLEHKIGHLRGIICAAPHPPRQIVSAELSCIAVQLLSISKNLAAEASSPTPNEETAVSPTPIAATIPNEGDSDSSDRAEEEEDDEERPPPAGSYEIVELDREEILAPHVHSCKVCGKGFKRDANLRMHMRGHGEEYKTAAALAKPVVKDAPPTSTTTRCFYSCPFVGCKRNREHRSFQPLKTAVCVKNHYRRSHCDKSYTCRRCNVKRFSVLADLRTHEKHCGRDRWVCSCGTSFSRKDKLFGHVAAFDGHTPALPPEDDDAAAHSAAATHGVGSGSASDQRLDMDTEAVSRIANMHECFSDSMFDGLSCSDDIKGFALTGVQCPDDGRGSFAPMGLDFCDFDGIDLFGAPGIVDF